MSVSYIFKKCMIVFFLMLAYGLSLSSETMEIRAFFLGIVIIITIGSFLLLLILNRIFQIGKKSFPLILFLVYIAVANCISAFSEGSLISINAIKDIAGNKKVVHNDFFIYYHLCLIVFSSILFILNLKKTMSLQEDKP